MSDENDHNYVRVKKTFLLVVALIIVAGLVGWRLGQSNDSSSNQARNTSSNNASEPTASNNANGPDVKGLVSYSLPDGWREATCPSAVGSVFVIPSGSGSVDCSANPSSPVKISVDPANNDDCNDLQNVQNVRKHICISEYINDHLSLKAETIYNQESSYGRETVIHAYYINTGKGIIKVEYIYNSDNRYQVGFEQLAKSVRVE